MRKYTLDTIKTIIEDDGNSLISTEYKDNKTPIEIECGICKCKYKVSFGSYKEGTKCKKCSDKEKGIKRRVSENDVKQLMEKRGDIFKKLYYIKYKAHVEFECGCCHKIFNLVYFHYKHQLNCISIKRKSIINYEYIQKYINQSGEELISTKYINTDSLLEIKCQKCNQIYKKSWHSFTSGSRCGLCSPSKKKTIDEIKTFIENKGDSLVSIEYKNCHDKLDIQCGNCNTIFNMSYSLYKISNCPKCAIITRSNKLKLSQEYVSEYIKSYDDKLISQYIDMNSKLEIECGYCNNIFKMSFGVYKHDNCRCQCTSMSRGERIIKEYLIKNNISYVTQKSFPDCKRKLALKYDFYLPDSDILIEFDGEIHFKSINVLGGDKTLKNRRESDIIKNIYCIKNNKNMLRISYNHIKIIGKIIDTYLENKNKKIIEYSSIKVYDKMIIDTYEQLLLTEIN